MRQSLHTGYEPNLQKIVITSAVIHLLFITLITIPLKTKEREYKTYFVNIVSPVAVQKPSTSPAVKGKGKTEKNSVKVKPAPRRRVSPKKGVSLEPVKTERVSKEIERLRAISALEKKKSLKEQELARAREADESVEEAIAGIRKGRTVNISKGAGVPGVQSSADSESYYAVITEKIWSEWIYPDIDMSDLETVISIKIDSTGEIVSQQVEQSSGNKIFDRSASKAIIKASPLPPPPVEMEVGLRFRL